MDYMKDIKEISAEEAVILWQASRLSLSKIYEKAPEILKVQGSVIGTLGNFSASIGKAKSKKTFNVSAIVAAALKNGTVLRYVAELPEEKRKILYVDTEQSPYHCLKVMKRILRMAGLPDDRDNEHLEFLALRKYTPEQRIRIVEQAIYNTPDIGLVIIDGIRDMVYDINSPGESTRIISKLMQWTDDRQIHIHTILHQNKGDDNTRGHIGTELNNKAETVLQITKSTQDGNISEVKAMHIRDREFDPFAFRINDSALPEAVDGYVFKQPSQDRGFPLAELTEQQHRTALENGFGKQVIYGYENVLKTLKQGYASIGYKRGRNIHVDLNKFLVNKRMIVKEGKGYRYNPDFHY
ncbi:AAA family ATPase [Phocaeicola sp. RTP21198st1_B8_RTP21198_201120]|uniref:AAA family ATPase n=1 Tax=Phocaeicola sp. RTP21198st1_B8_RTP21198_201120 TaxID=3143217 RepID=UPI0034A4D066